MLPDRVGARRGPSSSSDLTELARRADVVVFSLPDGGIFGAGRTVIAEAPQRRVTHMVDTSTVGVAAARGDRRSSRGGGSRLRGRAGVWRGRRGTGAHAVGHVCGLGRGMPGGRASPRRAERPATRVGDRPGMAQALKLANNFLSATALAATSEAIAFGLSVGLEMETMLEVIDAVERAERGQPGQVPESCADRSLRRRVRQFADVQGPEAVPGRGRGAGCAIGAGDRHRIGVGAVRGRRARGRLHPHLPVRGRTLRPMAGARRDRKAGWRRLSRSLPHDRRSRLEWREYRCELWLISICARATRSAWAWPPRCSRSGTTIFSTCSNENPPEALRQQIEAAVRTCPKNAISIED